MTVLRADQCLVGIHLRGASKLVIDPACMGYSKAALQQLFHYVIANNSKHKENHLVQVKLHSENFEELSTHLHLRKLNPNLNFRQTLSQCDELKYSGEKVRNLEGTFWNINRRRNPQPFFMGILVVLYVIIGLLCLYAAVYYFV
jgi:hypothetical protein